MQEINFSNKNGLWCKGKVKMTLAHHKHKRMIMYIKELWLSYVVRKNAHLTCKAIWLINPLRHGWWVDVVRRKLKIFHAREKWQLTFRTNFVSQIHLKIWEITLKNCQTNTQKTFLTNTWLAAGPRGCLLDDEDISRLGLSTAAPPTQHTSWHIVGISRK